MNKVNGSSKFGYVCHFEDDERGDIYFSLAHQGESCASVARRYEVSPSVIRRVFRQMVDGSAGTGGLLRSPGRKPHHDSLLRGVGRNPFNHHSREEAEQAKGKDQ